MKIEKQILAGLFFLFVSAVSFAAEAGGPVVANPPGAITFSFLGGYYWFSPKRGLNNTEVPTIDAAYNFDNHWAAELGWTPMSTSQKGSYGGQNVTGNLVTLDGIYRFAQHGRFQPYVMAGVGNIGLKASGSNSTQQGVFNAGVGAQLFAEKYVAFRGEVRDVYTTTQGINDVMASVGLSFLIG